MPSLRSTRIGGVRLLLFCLFALLLALPICQAAPMAPRSLEGVLIVFDDLDTPGKVHHFYMQEGNLYFCHPPQDDAARELTSREKPRFQRVDNDNQYGWDYYIDQRGWRWLECRSFMHLSSGSAVMLYIRYGGRREHRICNNATLRQKDNEQIWEYSPDPAVLLIQEQDGKALKATVIGTHGLPEMDSCTPAPIHSATIYL